MEKIHFIGIGGIGMSALAEVLLSRGNIVTGSDIRTSNLTEDLASKGVNVFSSHSRDNIDDTITSVIRSTCIREDNPEIIRAKELKIPVVLRGELLKKVISETEKSISITGTHGKTTTSALVSHITEYCGMDPIVIVGGEMNNFNGNAKIGRGNLVVAEVDESDGYFRNIDSTYAIITNIEREHMEHYASMNEVLSSYFEFMSRVNKTGFLGELTVERVEHRLQCGGHAHIFVGEYHHHLRPVVAPDCIKGFVARFGQTHVLLELPDRLEVVRA